MYTYGTEGYQALNKLIDKISPSKILVIDDTNTHASCYPYFNTKFNHKHRVVTILPGEENKSLKTVQQLWDKMLDFDLDRKSLIINLGGGIVTDLGGFVASTYKRGIPFIHIPTSLLGMVDAAIGGKNGINFGGAKNQIGVIVPPEMILIDMNYLKTLPENEFKSGYAEMLKHGLIKDMNYWSQLIADFNKKEFIEKNIAKSVEIKNEIITQDPNENGIRKILNFGHTLGHAIESYSQEKNRNLSHGHAVALGIIIALYLSNKKLNLPFTFVNEVKEVLKKIYPIPTWNKKDVEGILRYLIYDKKNISGEILFVLLKKPGEAVYNQKIENDLILESFHYLMNE
jgi:3-dehydroquinate synthase